MPKLKISLFGESYKVKYLKCEPPLLTKISDTFKMLDQDLILSVNDPAFFQALNEPGIESIRDLKFFKIGGLKNSIKSQIEIWFNGKKIQKIKLDELFRPSTLFSLFNTVTKSLSESQFGAGLYIVEEAIGLIGSYERQIERFDLQQLQFELYSFINLQSSIELLVNLTYAGINLKPQKEDSLITRYYGFLLT